MFGLLSCQTARWVALQQQQQQPALLLRLVAAASAAHACRGANHRHVWPLARILSAGAGEAGQQAVLVGGHPDFPGPGCCLRRPGGRCASSESHRCRVGLRACGAVVAVLRWPACRPQLLCGKSAAGGAGTPPSLCSRRPDETEQLVVHSRSAGKIFRRGLAATHLHDRSALHWCN